MTPTQVRHRNVQAIVSDESGNLAIGTKVTALSSFSNLMNVFSPPVSIGIMNVGEPTRVGFLKVGTSLRKAMGNVRDRAIR